MQAYCSWRLGKGNEPQSRDAFKELKPEFFKKNMRKPILIDGWRIYDVETYSRELEFAAIGIG